METSIQTMKATRERLKMYGHKGETYDALINRLLNEVDTARREKQTGF